MTANNPTTNGEYYDHERQTWMVQCGPDNVPFRKKGTDGKPIVPDVPADKKDDKNQMNQHIEPYAVMICAYCGKSNGTLLPNEHDEDGNPIRWHHAECKKAADRVNTCSASGSGMILKMVDYRRPLTANGKNDENG